MDTMLRNVLPTIMAVLAMLLLSVLPVTTKEVTTPSGTPNDVRTIGKPNVTNLTRAERTVSNITVTWNITSIDVLFYRITCTLKQSTFPISQDPTSTLSNRRQTRFTVENLYHAALYEISVTARNRYGYGNTSTIEVWTDIQKPPAPPIPTVITDEVFDTNFTMSLNPVGSMTTGPLSGFLVVIEELEPDGSNPNNGSTNIEDNLVNFTEAKRLDLNHYITAEILFLQLQLPAKFIVGDLALYNGYFNAPLQPDSTYNVHFGVISRLDTIEKITFCDPVEVVTSEGIKEVHDDTDEADTSNTTVMIIAISAAAGAVIITVVVIIVVVVMLRKQDRKIPLIGPVVDKILNKDQFRNDKSDFNTSSVNNLTLKSVAELTLTTDKVRQKMKGILKEKTIMNDPSQNLYIHDELSKKRQTLRKKKSISNGLNVADLETFDKGKDNVKQHTEEFSELKLDTITNLNATSIVGSMPENVPKNPFGKRILPFDAYRVKVGDTNDPHFDYINATHVKISRSDYKGILTGRAQPNTMGLFWTMLYEQEVNTLVSLDDNPFDDFKDTVLFDNFKVSLTSVKQFADFTKRTFVMYIEKTQETRQLTQWQYNTWTKGGIPDNTFAFVDFLSLILSGPITQAPIVVESMDGVGRTGMFWALILLREQGLKTGKINVPKCVQKLRTFNQYFVKTNKQYSFIYEALMEIFRMGDTQLPALKMKSSIKNTTVTHPETGVSPMRKQYDFMYGPPQMDDIVCDLEYVNSHCKLKQFAITKESFMEDIIELSFDADTKCIILLDDTFEDEPQLKGVNKQTIIHGMYMIKYTKKTNQSLWNIQKWNMKIRTLEDSRVKQVLLIKIDNWPANQECLPIQTMLDLIRLVDKKTQSSPQSIMINSMAGLNRAALVVGMFSIYQRLIHHQQTDIYMSNMIMKQTIPQLHLSWGQYKYFHKATAEIGLSQQNPGY